MKEEKGERAKRKERKKEEKEKGRSKTEIAYNFPVQF